MSSFNIKLNKILNFVVLITHPYIKIFHMKTYIEVFKLKNINHIQFMF